MKKCNIFIWCVYKIFNIRNFYSAIFIFVLKIDLLAKYLKNFLKKEKLEVIKLVQLKYKNLLIITPGIRLPGDSSNDQMRITTPREAFKNKVSGIVLGRSLTKGNLKNNIKRLLDHLKKWSKIVKFVVYQI